MAGTKEKYLTSPPLLKIFVNFLSVTFIIKKNAKLISRRQKHTTAKFFTLLNHLDLNSTKRTKY